MAIKGVRESPLNEKRYCHHNDSSDPPKMVSESSHFRESLQLPTIQVRVPVKGQDDSTFVDVPQRLLCDASKKLSSSSMTINHTLDLVND